MAKNKEGTSSELERRKNVRLRVRPDLAITNSKYEGRNFFIIKDPISLRYYRFKEQEHFLIRMMDGTHTLDDAQKAFEQRFRPDRLTLEDLEQFGQQLLTAGLVQNESADAGKQLYERRGKRLKQDFMKNYLNILYLKIPLFDPEKLLNRMVPYVRFMFTWWFGLFSLGVMLWALLLVLSNFAVFREKLPSFQEFFQFKTIIYLWAALGIVKVIHEFGHGLSCKAFGGEVHEMGLLFLCLSPCMYCNVSDAWTLPNKWKRIIISGAGIYVELMIAAIATFVWWNTPNQPFVNYMALCLMVVCSVSTVMFNGNPLMRFDGYYVLSDLLEIPNLREKATRYLGRVVQEHCLGIEQPPEPYMALGRRILFVTYASFAWCYRWFITFFILRFMATFLKPYKLEVISQMLMLFALGSMFGFPIARMIKNLRKRGRLPDMKPVRVTITSIVVASLLFVFFFVPLPVSRVRQTGVVEIQNGEVMQVHVEAPGFLEKVHVKEGQQVSKGTILAEFRNYDVEEQQDNHRTTKRSKSVELDKYRELRLKSRDRQEIKKLMELEPQARAEYLAAKTALDNLNKYHKDRLVLRAPCDGVVMGLPKMDLVGQYWRAEEGKAFCSIGDPNKLRMLVPLDPSDYDLVRWNLEKARDENRQIPVTLRIEGRGSQTWKGRITQLSGEEAKTIPPALANKTGGPIAVNPDPKTGEMVPQTQVYLVSIAFLDPDRAIISGMRGQAKVHCEYRSLAWWFWRTISDTFDIGLL